MARACHREGRVLVALHQMTPPDTFTLLRAEGRFFSTSDSGLSTDNPTEPYITDEYKLCDVTTGAMTSLANHF